MNVDESIDYLLKIVIKKLEDYEKNAPIKTEKSINILTKNKHKKKTCCQINFFILYKMLINQKK